MQMELVKRLLEVGERDKKILAQIFRWRAGFYPGWDGFQEARQRELRGALSSGGEKWLADYDAAVRADD